nr:DUF262 domain-containing protein [uncultured Cohaesibacter sp.]
MAVSPTGISIQSLYRDYRDGKLIVNRQYQRKLVWTEDEKRSLIDSILRGYPLPLFLLAERNSKEDESQNYREIIDGMQRLNAIFSFIEHGFLLNNKCFDLNEFARARQAAEACAFKQYPENVEKLTPSQCSIFLDYQLAVTSFSGDDENKTVDVFGRINSGGRQLSVQEQRQAGVVSEFAELVRELSCEVRGDVSKKELLLSEMPEISIDTSNGNQGYDLKAEEIFWCKQGILRTGDLRNSEDEELIADICASILTNNPVPGTRPYRDELYRVGSSKSLEIERSIRTYGYSKIKKQFIEVYSTLKTCIESSSLENNHFRNVVYKGTTSNAQKSPFYAVFMAFFDLIIKEEKYPNAGSEVMAAITDLTGAITVGQKQTNSDDRVKNILKVKGLLSNCFVKKDVSKLTHGAALTVEFENSIRRSRTETVRYEFKQGILNLGSKKLDLGMRDKIVNTICAIANHGPEADGFLYIGIADKKADAEKIANDYNISPITFEHVSVVGVSHEAKKLKCSLNDYLDKITRIISQSNLSTSVKIGATTSIDAISYHGLDIVRICVPKQSEISFVGDECYIREGSNTKLAKPVEVASITKKFQ